MKIVIRKGHAADGHEALDVLHRSIAELCILDHNDDENETKDWLSNKTEGTWVIPPKNNGVQK